ncbi:MAG: sterol desaturase family protein [Planctomycetes bacterium]|nr:sterol desaturase family protein [Planctomycetota bacterium]
MIVAIQATLVVLDVFEHLWGGKRRGSEAVQLRPLIFLFLVTLVFLVLQVGGLSLVPEASELFASVRGLYGGYFDEVIAAPVRGVPLLLVGVLAFYVAGLWDYLVHRFVSHSRWLWFTHEYHHLPNQVSVVMPGILVRPFAAFPLFLTLAATSLSIYAVFVLAGFPLWDLTPALPLLGVIAVVLTASHSSFLRRFAAVHHVMRLVALTTPQEHLLHHTVGVDGNYGNFTTMWDRVFGTYLDPLREENRGKPLGLSYDQDFLGTLTFGLAKLPPSIRGRCQLARFCNIEAKHLREGDLEGSSTAAE